ncbi:trans-sulfuration enzyme family protein [Schlesneria paludicola]|uniref:trans-sulfuration enzyme family protein n=1 Tax=Schlesneria paludicola TaxID=360056 RepID=UPI00029AAD1A|nr:aminotransferase class I/II-fold pyridoxal phosphate-dependent enzyme [Schlesneria paludicola]
MTDKPIDPAAAQSTITARGGWSSDFTTRTSAPPVYMTTAFDIESLEQLDSVVGGQEKGYIYTRDGNPNHEAFASDVAQLEGAESGVVTASGMGALTAVLMAMVKSGDHVLAARVLYGRTGQLLNHLANSFGLQVTYFDLDDLAALKAAITSKTKLCIVESISNPLLEVADLPEIVGILGAIPLLVDNTFATPCLLKPIEHGATLVWHSVSKYLNGHGDVMAGVVVGPDSLMRRIRAMSSLYGVNANPFESWLANRGLRTLPLRMARVSQTANSVAQFLSAQPQVSRVIYPGLADHPHYERARRLLPDGCSGMLAFDLPGGRGAVDCLFRTLSDRIPFSPTLADARTTLSYPTGTSHKFMTTAERAACGITDGLVRLSIGLEDPADLQRELGEALAKLI